MKRFDKLEPERQTPSKPGGRPSLERFEQQPATRTHAEGWDPAKAEALAPTTLERFSSDGTDGARVATDALQELPSLECPACNCEAGKFERRCASCGAALDSPEAVQLNLARVARLREQKTADWVQAAERARQAEAEVVLEEQRRRARGEEIARAVKQSYLLRMEGPQGTPRFIRLFLGALAVIVAGLLHEHRGHSAVFFVGVGAVLLLTCLPRGFLAWLWEFATRHRRRW